MHHRFTVNRVINEEKRRPDHILMKLEAEDGQVIALALTRAVAEEVAAHLILLNPAKG